MTPTVWSIADLTAFDANGRVMKTAYGAFITDHREPGTKGFRVRWRVGLAGSTLRAHNRSFKRHELEEARRFHQSLLDAASSGSAADEHGLPVVRRPVPSSAQPILFEDAANQWAEEVAAKATSSKSRAHIWTQVGFAVETMRATDTGELFWTPDSGRESLWLDDIDSELCLQLLMARRHTDRRAMKGYLSRLADYERYEMSLEDPSRPGPKPREVSLPDLPEHLVSSRTEEAFSDVMGWMFRDLAERGWLPMGLWTLASRMARSAAEKKISDRMVLTRSQIWELADRVASVAGGERYRAPVLVAGESALRMEELYALDRGSFTDDFATLRVEFAEVVTSRRHNPTGETIERRPLKARREGETRNIPQTSYLPSVLEEHFDRFVPEGGRFLSNPDGSLIVQRNIWVNRYFKPAVAEMFAESHNEYLKGTLPRDLRKAAINWWLTSGTSVAEAAFYAGHSPQTLNRYYAAASQEAEGRFRAMIDATPPWGRGHLQMVG